MADSRGPSSSHPEALGRLVDAPWGTRVDKRRTVSLPLPDASAWTQVRFYGVTTVVGFRYGDSHHAVAAVFAFDARGDASVDRCAARFAAWGRPRAKDFDLVVGDPRVETIAWGPKGEKAKIFVFDTIRRSIFGETTYAAAYAVYPAWKDACLIVGMAAPDRDAGSAASTLRDRLVRDALPALVVRPSAGAQALEAKIDFD